MLSTHLIADVLRVLMLVSCTGCSSQLEAFPRRACVFDSGGRYRAGQVIAKRDNDDAVLFEFNDRFEGDHGFLWIAKDDPSKRIRPCMEATLTDPPNQKPTWEHK